MSLFKLEGKKKTLKYQTFALWTIARRKEEASQAPSKNKEYPGSCQLTWDLFPDLFIIWSFFLEKIYFFFINLSSGNLPVFLHDLLHKIMWTLYKAESKINAILYPQFLWHLKVCITKLSNFSFYKHAQWAWLFQYKI